MTSADDTQRELIRLQERWADAVKRLDMPFLERLLGEEFTLTTGRPGFEVASRQEWLAVTKDGHQAHYPSAGRLGGRWGAKSAATSPTRSSSSIVNAAGSSLSMSISPTISPARRIGTTSSERVWTLHAR